MVAAISLFCFPVQSGPISKSISIPFIHTGDDADVGTASLLEWKWSADTTLSWDQWTMVSNSITPMVAYTPDTAIFEVVFPDNGIYWIAVNAADEVNNWSGVCIIAEVRVPDIIAPSCIGGNRVIIQ